MGTSHAKGVLPVQPLGLTYCWYKKEEFQDLPAEHQAWLHYEKKRRDNKGLNDKKKEKRHVKALLYKERCRLAKLKSMLSKKDEKKDQDDDAGTDK